MALTTRRLICSSPGAQPTVNISVTNILVRPATLYGWIDYNANGVFENATERGSIAVPSGTNNSVVTLTFPAVPSGYTEKNILPVPIEHRCARGSSYGTCSRR